MTEPTTETAPVPPVPPMPQHPPAVPAVPTLPAAPAPPAPVRDRRVLRAVARWTLAVLVCGGLGTGTALGITSMERTDVPGLATESDGRWDYPKLGLPALPEGSPRPFTQRNDGEIHHADLRKLLLPAPAGATADSKLNGGWVGVDQYLSLYGKEYRTGLKQDLSDSALRHIAARGWTMPDGTRTSIHLLRFNSVAYAEAFKDESLKVGEAHGAFLDGVVDQDVFGDLATEVTVEYTSIYAYEEPKPHGPEQKLWAYVQAGDTLALITQTRRGEALAVPFQQTVTLQNQLLG
ncbi:hypothetical protein [Streptomyces formicae]|uniref:Uncharacterized protein n=1 Tax=Streptomyces formicae TaxID=1616117 RepID=A0ABY3WZP7_9ACTN|nr:hypothetical protein [Streptomyces formicae]UNM15966.1 hypothetical protein J4032_34845 [Streptomyces formicae]